MAIFFAVDISQRIEKRGKNLALTSISVAKVNCKYLSYSVS